jgi:hypothetical protein
MIIQILQKMKLEGLISLQDYIQVWIVIHISHLQDEVTQEIIHTLEKYLGEMLD